MHLTSVATTSTSWSETEAREVDATLLSCRDGEQNEVELTDASSADS
ncbi:MAG: hypothetical protein AAGF31_01110 [Planctomycetota bacterium]